VRFGAKLQLIALLVQTLVAITGTAQTAICSLPPDLHRELAARYSGWSPVTTSDLEKDDLLKFQNDHHDRCPGMTSVDFYGDGKPTLALVLKKGAPNNPNSQLILAHYVSGKWKISKIDTGGTNAYAPVVWSEQAGKYEGVDGRTLMARTPVIVFCKYESWAIVYALTPRGISKVWVND
jgi:hypothetical protein